MARCVCGCDQDAHVPYALSVPLRPNPTPLYPLPKNAMIADHGSWDANVMVDRCRCGCMSFMLDTSVPV